MFVRWFIAPLIFSALVASVAEPVAQDSKAAIEKAAREFGLALTQAELSRLKPLLPRRGKVHLRLQHLGPEQGSYSAGQVLALLDDFLQVGSVRSFELSPRCDGDRRRYSLVRGRADVRDREGRDVVVELHLTLVPEDGRWILREIRETPR
jgi:hypothetical protein